MKAPIRIYPRLVNALIAKSILETILVGTIAVVVYLNAFPPTFHGWGEAVAASKEYPGWAVNDTSPWERVEVQLFIDGKLVWNAGGPTFAA